jgi:hypothetical protein
VVKVLITRARGVRRLGAEVSSLVDMVVVEVLFPTCREGKSRRIEVRAMVFKKHCYILGQESDVSLGVVAGLCSDPLSECSEIPESRGIRVSFTRPLYIKTSLIFLTMLFKCKDILTMTRRDHSVSSQLERRF